MGDRLTVLLPRVGFGALVAAAFLVPVACTNAVADSFSLPKATISWIATVLAVVGVAGWSASHRAWPFPRLGVLAPMAVLVGWTTVATAVSLQPWVSVLGRYGRDDGLVALVSGVAVALAIVAFTWRAPERLGWIAGAVALSGAASLVVVVAQGLGWRWRGWTLPGQPASQIIGLAGNPNFSGALLALAVPFVLGLRGRVAGAVPRAALAAGALGLAGGVAWTGTRAGGLALLAGTTCLSLLAPELLPKVVRIAVAVAFAIAVGVVALSSSTDALPGTREFGPPGPLQTASLGERQNVWAGVAAIVGDRPLVGVGPDALSLRFPYERTSRGNGRGLITADEAHDVYLDRAVSAGLPAAAAYLWLVAVVLIAAWRARRRIAVEQRWLLGAFGGALAGYLAQGIFSIDMVPLAFVSWLSVGALVSLADPKLIDQRGGPLEPPRCRPIPVVALAALVVVGLGLVAVALRPALADRHARRGIDALSDGRPLDAYREYAAAASWLDHEPSYQLRQASALLALSGAADTDPELRRTLISEALVADRHALDRAPGDVPTLVAMADAHVLAAEAASTDGGARAHLDAAASIYRRLFASVRADDAFHLGYARMFEVRARLGVGASAARDRDRAEAHDERARRYVPDRIAALEALARIAVVEQRYGDAKRLIVEAQRWAPGDPDLRAALAEVDRQLRGG